METIVRKWQNQLRNYFEINKNILNILPFLLAFTKLLLITETEEDIYRVLCILWVLFVRDTTLEFCWNKIYNFERNWAS